MTVSTKFCCAEGVWSIIPAPRQRNRKKGERHAAISEEAHRDRRNRNPAHRLLRRPRPRAVRADRRAEGGHARLRHRVLQELAQRGDAARHEGQLRLRRGGTRLVRRRGPLARGVHPLSRRRRGAQGLARSHESMDRLERARTAKAREHSRRPPAGIAVRVSQDGHLLS